MKKINDLIRVIKENKHLHYSLIVFIGIIVSLMLVKIQIRETHDGTFHMLRLIGIFDTIKQGQIPPIIVPDYCNGTGYAMMLFYPPLVTFLPMIFKLIIPEYTDALKLFGMFFIIFSGITMYNFTYRVTKKRSSALFSAVIYMIAPYKMGNIYKRYAIGEFVALTFMPVLFTGIHSLFNKDGKKHYYIALGTSLLILSHTITTVYAGIFCFIYVIFNIEKLKDKSVIKKIIINLFFILTITMLFYIPMFEAKSMAEYTIFDDTLMCTTSTYTQSNAMEISEFFIPNDSTESTILIIGIPILLLSLSSVLTYRKIDENYKKIYIIFLLFSIISLHMSSKYFPWKIMPNFLCKLQYPWRMMGFFNFFISLICSINLYILLKNFVKKDILKVIIICTLIIISIIYTLNLVSKYCSDSNIDDEYLKWFNENPKINHMYINRDYLPVKAIYLQKTYMKERPDETVVLEGIASIIDEEKDKLNDKMTLEYCVQNTVLEFPYLFYPGYNIVIKDNNEEIRLESIESENGYVSTILDKDYENVQIKVYYEPTILTKIAYIGSAISIVGFIIYVIIENRRKTDAK